MTEEQVFESFQRTKAYLKENNHLDYVLYKRNDKLIILSKKISTELLREKEQQQHHTEKTQIYFTKNELKILEVYRHIHDETVNKSDNITQIIYDYIVENIHSNNKQICLCETGECCRKCCIHPDTKCVWKNYVEADEWNDPEHALFFGNFKCN